MKRQLRNASLQKLDDSEKWKLSKGDEGVQAPVGSVVKHPTFIIENCSCCNCDVTLSQTVSFDGLLINCCDHSLTHECESNNILHVVTRSILLLPSEDKPVNMTHLSLFLSFSEHWEQYVCTFYNY